jgi:hypothetical protein
MHTHTHARTLARTHTHKHTHTHTHTPPTRAFPRGAPFVLIPTTDLVFYALGCGEYDEMAREWVCV